MIKLILWLQFFIFYYVLCLECFRNEEEKLEFHFSTSTPYRLIRNKNDTEMKFKGCEPIRLWGIIRHGARNPSKKHIRKMANNLVKIKHKILNSDNSLCENDIQGLRNWMPLLEESQAKFLVPEGEDELIELAERMQNRFPALLSTTYDNSTYKFKYTSTQRTELSAKSFAIGLFGRDNIKQIWYPESSTKDPILRFYKLCSRWRQEVNKNSDAFFEVTRFTESPEMKLSIDLISSKLGLSNLTWSDIKLIYTTCAFETSWNKFKISPWCSIFDKHTIKIYEFLKDLEHYWIDGYGHEITYKQACPAIVDMLNHISPSSLEPNTTLYFTHSGTILKFLSYLNLFKDDKPLLHTDFLLDRKWRVSKIDAFASNIVFITFKCNNGYYVLTQHQEQIIRLPGCPNDTDLCDFKTFANIFQNDWKNCKFNEMCEIKIPS